MTIPVACPVLDYLASQPLRSFPFPTSVVVDLQPDQKPEGWNDHVAVYEEAFEPLTNAFASRALEHLDLRSGDRLIDVGAGAGGAALLAASRGMVVRIAARVNAAAGIAGRGRAHVMDCLALGFPDGRFGGGAA